MFTEIFIVEIPDQFNDLGAGAERPKHRGSVIEDAPYFFIQLFRGLVQMDGERHIRLASAVFPHVLRLLIKAGVDRIILVPGDYTSRPGVLSIREPVVNAWYILLTDLAGPCVFVPSTMSIHLQQVPDNFARYPCVQSDLLKQDSGSAVFESLRVPLDAGRDLHIHFAID